MRPPRNSTAGPAVVREPRGLASHILLLLGVSAAALAACAKIGEDVLHHQTGPFDEPIRDFVLAHQNRPARGAFRVVTEAGAPGVLVPAAGLLAAWFWARRNLPIAAAVVLAPAVASGLFVSIKRAYARARPAGGAPRREQTYSFPSGHATTSAAVFGALGHVLWREKMLPRPAALTLATVPPLVIGTSRIYLDVHWATDVLGGWSVGALVAAFSGAVYERVRRKTREEGEPA
jgi:undecaprenyl-diphosphatase